MNAILRLFFNFLVSDVHIFLAVLVIPVSSKEFSLIFSTYKTVFRNRKYTVKEKKKYNDINSDYWVGRIKVRKSNFRSSSSAAPNFPNPKCQVSSDFQDQAPSTIYTKLSKSACTYFQEFACKPATVSNNIRRWNYSL